MTVNQLKQNLLWVGLLLSLILTIGIIVSLSQVISNFQEGADPASIFRGNDLNIPEGNQAIWDNESLSTEKSPTRAEQEEILTAYWNAWQALERVTISQDESDLSTYFALPVLDLLRGNLVEQASEFSTENHLLYLRFFSDDHSIVSFQDQFMMAIDISGQALDIPVHAEITMSNDTGRWRVRLMTLSYLPPQ